MSRGLQELKEKLDKHGSCMLGFDEEKWVMLDSLEQVSPGRLSASDTIPLSWVRGREPYEVGRVRRPSSGRDPRAPRFGSSDSGSSPPVSDLTDAAIVMSDPRLRPPGTAQRPACKRRPASPCNRPFRIRRGDQALLAWSSRLSSSALRAIPHRYPPGSPSVRTTRWRRGWPGRCRWWRRRAPPRARRPARRYAGRFH